MKELLVTAGVLALIGAAVGGGLTLMGNQLPVVGSVARQTLLGLLGAGFLVLGLYLGDGAGDGSEGGNGSTAPATVATTDPDGTTTTSRSSTTIDSGDSCVVTIANPLVALYEEPDRFSQEITGVSPGKYTVTDFRTVNRAGQNQRWLTIRVEGRSGWIPDDTFTVDSKSAGCP